jgi:hypothetical protein
MLKIGLYRGTNSGQAIYLGNGRHGYRIAGPKCWGFIEPVKEFEISARELESLIERAADLLMEERQRLRGEK